MLTLKLQNYNFENGLDSHSTTEWREANDNK